MSGRHRARKESVQIIKTGTVKDEDLRRPVNIQYIGKGVKYPIVYVKPRAASKSYRKRISSKKPRTFA